MEPSVSLIGSILGKLIDPVRTCLRRPRLEFLPFDAARDLKTWSLVGPIRRQQKVFTIEVRNRKRDIARRCVALLEVGTPSTTPRDGPLYVLHWADGDYAFRTTGAEPIDIGPEDRRLDVVFTFSEQPREGCWIATPAALVSPLATNDYLPPGQYDLSIEVKSENARSAKAIFRLTVPRRWDELGVVPEN